MSADAPANAGQRVRPARVPVGLFESPFGNQSNVPPGISVRRTSHHAGEVGVQPILIHLLHLKTHLHERAFDWFVGDDWI
jgi:hypothetical protein